MSHIFSQFGVVESVTVRVKEEPPSWSSERVGSWSLVTFVDDPEPGGLSARTAVENALAWDGRIRYSSDGESSWEVATLDVKQAQMDVERDDGAAARVIDLHTHTRHTGGGGKLNSISFQRTREGVLGTGVVSGADAAPPPAQSERVPAERATDASGAAATRSDAAWASATAADATSIGHIESAMRAIGGGEDGGDSPAALAPLPGAVTAANAPTQLSTKSVLSRLGSKTIGTVREVVQHAPPPPG
eukprot:COSAG01_NODE_212_length_21797_cov_14.197806_21_plen_246_part_00